MNETQIKTQKFIIKYFTEIMIKGSTAKRQMISQVFNNLVNILSKISKDIKIKKFFDKVEVVCPVEVVNEVRTKLLDTPGIQQILEAIQFDNMNTLDEIKVVVNDIMAKEIQGKTFVVRCKRTGTQEFKSTQVEQTVGGYMLAHNETKGVALKGAEYTINLELEFSQLNIITHKHMGMGGFPLGTQGTVLSLMSGGFDSTVASYLTMKRGIKTNFVFFNLGGLAHEIKGDVVGIQLGHALHGLEHTALEIVQVHGHIAHIVLPRGLYFTHIVPPRSWAFPAPPGVSADTPAAAQTWSSNSRPPTARRWSVPTPASPAWSRCRPH